MGRSDGAVSARKSPSKKTFAAALRDWRDVSVIRLMPRLPAPRFLCAILLAGAGTGASGADDVLPAGGSTAFREWMESNPAPRPERPTVQSTRISPALPRLSSRFGYRIDPLRHVQRMHDGIDIPGPFGTPVHASADGIVRRAGAAGSYGNLIEIDHGAGLTTRYAHLSRLLVRPGAPVERGQTIALIGSTGRSTGNHLHFEVRLHGHATGPLAYMTANTEMTFVPQAPAGPHVSVFAKRTSVARADDPGS